MVINPFRIKSRLLTFFCFYFSLGLGSVVIAEELQVIELEGTQIRGSQELPSVSYLVPWQPPIPADITAPDSVPVSVSNMQPLERGEFRRIIDFHDQFLSTQRLPESQNTADQ